MSSHKHGKSIPKHAGGLRDGADSTKEDVGTMIMAVMATKDALGSLLETAEEAKGATRDSNSVTSLELMSSGVATWGCGHAEAMLIQELDLDDVGSISSAEDRSKDGRAQEDADGEDVERLHFDVS